MKKYYLMVIAIANNNLEAMNILGLYYHVVY